MTLAIKPDKNTLRPEKSSLIAAPITIAIKPILIIITINNNGDINKANKVELTKINNKEVLMSYLANKIIVGKGSSSNNNGPNNGRMNPSNSIASIAKKATTISNTCFLLNLLHLSSDQNGLIMNLNRHTKPLSYVLY